MGRRLEPRVSSAFGEVGGGGGGGEAVGQQLHCRAWWLPDPLSWSLPLSLPSHGLLAVSRTQARPAPGPLHVPFILSGMVTALPPFFLPPVSYQPGLVSDVASPDTYHFLATRPQASHPIREVKKELILISLACALGSRRQTCDLALATAMRQPDTMPSGENNQVRDPAGRQTGCQAGAPAPRLMGPWLT